MNYIRGRKRANLFSHQINEIRELIRTLGKEKMIILSSHILQEISAIGTRIMIIKDGRIVADDTPQNMQRSLGDKTGFRARVQGPAEEVAAALKGLDGVNSVEITAGGGADTEFRLLTSAGEDIGSRVFKAVAGKGWELSALSPDEHSLEDVYLELTKDAASTGPARALPRRHTRAPTDRLASATGVDPGDGPAAAATAPPSPLLVAVSAAAASASAPPAAMEMRFCRCAASSASR